MPAARAAHAALHRGHARFARHRHPGSREPFPHAVVGARLARPLHHPRVVRGRRCAGGRHPPRRPHPCVRRFRPGRHLRHHRHDARPARVRRARHAVHPPPLRGGLCHHPGGHRALVAGQTRLPGHRRLRHRLQGRGAAAAGARHRGGRHRPSRAFRPRARGRARGRSEVRLRLPQRHPGRRGRGAQAGAGAGRTLRQAAPVAPATPTSPRSGTIADLMPMRDENRALVADGLASHQHRHPRPCIAALLDTSGAWPASRFPPPTSASPSSRV